ncbi:MAG: UvrD-helicase domain-containing protein [Christensenellales bacterium]|jgi:superfamily I DNA/RNA helicase
MEVNVAGAGAGKTTKMADLIMSHDIPYGKILFCIAFTNAAADNIKQKVIEKLGAIPSNIKISTIHSFLYQELIKPYYYFLYGKHFERLSIITLPTKHTYKAQKLSELEASNTLHFTKIPEKAKWVVSQKTRDKNSIKTIRQKILSRFVGYCAAIFVDEAQDMSKDIYTTLIALDKAGVQINLFGDPKQDVKGFNYFRKIIDDKTAYVTYTQDCFRCPQKHLDLSNRFASAPEKQVADKKNAAGSISIIFESDIENINEFIDVGNYGLRYISKKCKRFDTHNENKKVGRFDTLWYEVSRAVNDKWQGQKTENEIERFAFYVTEKMLECFDISNHAYSVVEKFIKHGAFEKLPKKRYNQMISAFKKKKVRSSDAVVVSSIEMVKGIEAERCLFILTTDLAPYLFQEKTDDNKMKHLLYVALTRSLDHLTILITREVEDKYTRTYVADYFC